MILCHFSKHCGICRILGVCVTISNALQFFGLIPVFPKCTRKLYFEVYPCFCVVSVLFHSRQSIVYNPVFYIKFSAMVTICMSVYGFCSATASCPSSICCTKVSNSVSPVMEIFIRLSMSSMSWLVSLPYSLCRCVSRVRHVIPANTVYFLLSEQ